MTPRSTYRIQLRNGLGLDDVVEQGWLDHAAALGASHLYLSPVLTATPGSTHGYDVVDPRRVDPAIGGDVAFERLAAAAARRGMGLVVDVVPNHMATDQAANPWWWDLLRNGELSEHAGTFDVDFAHPEHRLRGLIVLPVLDDHYGRVLEAGRIVVARDPDLGAGRAVTVHVDDRPFPIEPASLGALLAPVADSLGDDVFHLVARSLERIEAHDPAVRSSELRVLDVLVGELLDRPEVQARVDDELAAVSADVDRVHQLLEAQNYRLAFWRSSRDLGYRRFFDINDLVGVRVEDPSVFDTTHSAVRSWVERNLVDGLRIDHPDGLADPLGYLQRLRALGPDQWIVVEKILESEEQLPSSWPVDGTTGYEVAERYGRWLLHPDGLERLGAMRDELVGPAPDVHDLVASCKEQVLSEMLGADLARATEAFVRLCASLRRFRDVTRHECHEVLRETAVALPVYRTYVEGRVATGNAVGAERGSIAVDGDPAVTERLVTGTLATVSERRADLDPEVVDLLRSVLTGRLDDVTPLAAQLRVRVEQLTGPTMAKGKEDTAFYREVRLVSRNEVGAEPSAPGLSADELHAFLSGVAESHPATMTNLSTHDSKRSEDVRARLAVLSEVPERWAELARRWMERSDAADPCGRVDLRTRYLAAQTVVGAHPLSAERLSAYLLKAVREAKDRTSWLVADSDYEEAVQRYAASMSEDEDLTDEIDRFVLDVLEVPGAHNSIVQKALQLCGPGVPDVYWGSEGRFLRLVDPDNRITPALAELDAASAPDLTGTAPRDWGRDKLGVVAAVLALRSRHPDGFGLQGDYRSINVGGPDAERLVAFGRGRDVAVVASRWSTRGPVDPSTRVHLEPGEWRDVLGGPGASVMATDPSPVADVMGRLGVAVLERIAPESAASEPATSEMQEPGGTGPKHMGASSS